MSNHEKIAPKNAIKCEECSSTIGGFLCHLDAQILNEVNENKVNKKFKRGQIIFKEGGPTQGIYCIRTGKVKITKESVDHKQTIVQLMGVGDLIGHYGIFNGGHYIFTAVALEETEACFLDYDFTLSAVRKSPSFALALVHLLSKEIIESETKFASVVQSNVRERLAGLLLTLAKSFGVNEENRIRLTIKLTRDEMASMIGTVNETVIRFISEFKDEALIEEEGKTIFILDVERLMEFANLS